MVIRLDAGHCRVTVQCVVEAVLDEPLHGTQATLVGQACWKTLQILRQQSELPGVSVAIVELRNRTGVWLYVQVAETASSRARKQVEAEPFLGASEADG